MDVIISPIAKEYAMERDDCRAESTRQSYVIKHPQKRDEKLGEKFKYALFEEEKGPLYGPRTAN